MGLQEAVLALTADSGTVPTGTLLWVAAISAGGAVIGGLVGAIASPMSDFLSQRRLSRRERRDLYVKYLAALRTVKSNAGELSKLSQKVAEAKESAEKQTPENVAKLQGTLARLTEELAITSDALRTHAAELEVSAPAAAVKASEELWQAMYLLQSTGTPAEFDERMLKVIASERALVRAFRSDARGTLRE